jgi:hypothetical protein
MKTTKLNLFLVLGLFGSLAAAAHAESFSITVPFAFTASGKNLPAGTYSVEPVAAGLLVIRGASAADTATISAAPGGDTMTPANAALRFESQPEIAVLSSIRMESGMTFAVMPAKHLASASPVPAKGTVALSHP